MHWTRPITRRDALAVCGLSVPLASAVGSLWWRAADGSGQALAAEVPELSIEAPIMAGPFRTNQVASPQPYTIGISDEAMIIAARKHMFRGRAPGMKNVMLRIGPTWYPTTLKEDGEWSSEIDLSQHHNGPLVFDVLSWDSKQSDFKYNINTRVHLFVVGGRDGTPPAEAPKGHPAAGMALVWSDEFTEPLSTSSRRTRSSTWFQGGKPELSEFGDAWFPEAGDKRNPFYQRDSFLRIRAQHDPDLVDPFRWNRKWWSGFLSTGFPDGSASFEFREGYVEARMMCPAGKGPFPAFWLLDSESTVKRKGVDAGAVELDVLEHFGFEDAYQIAVHKWPPLLPNGKPDQSKADGQLHFPRGDVTNEFHTFGCKLTRTEMTFYKDGVEQLRKPLFRAETVSPFYIMINLALGGGWPVIVPPSGYYDLWIDYVRAYA
jgi:beta-glucanase (GH16 family)